MNLTLNRPVSYLGFVNQIPSEFDDLEGKISERINFFLENFTPTENQVEVFSKMIDRYINLGFSDVLFNEVEIDSTIEDEILLTKKTENGVKIIFIDEDGDLGYNNTPYEGDVFTILLDYNDDICVACDQFIV
jgi:hypothetical protein